MEEVALEDFILEPFDNENMMHRFVSVLLDNDSAFHDYVGETQYLVESAHKKQEKGLRDSVYVARCKKEYLGIISLIILHNDPYIAMGIIPEKRGHHYGSNVLKEYIEYLFREYPEYDAVFASIIPKNEKSINNVLKLGFNQVTQTKYVKSR